MLEPKSREKAYVDEHFQEFVEELRAAVRRPSIAAQNVGMDDAARFFKDMLERYGISARIIPTEGGYPCVVGEVKGKSDKTVLFYDHYDVQPPDPLNEWVSEPFSGEIRDGCMFARGVSDNKGNACARIQAVGTLLKLRGELPVTVKFLIEGEEEIGSPHLASFIKANRDILKADCGVWESGYIGRDGRPGMYLGVKGMLYVELEATGPAKDMHSGSATYVPNPAWKLVWALSSIKDGYEKVLIPGFYDGVTEITPEDMALIEDAAAKSKLPTREDAQSMGLSKGFLLNLEGIDLLKQQLFSPTANICGFVSGYTGEGQKTVLPSRARAKMDFRLVPDQDPYDILEKLKKHLKDNGFEDISVRLVSADWPVKTPANHPVVEAARRAALSVYGKPASIAPTQGGSGPMKPFKDYLNLPMVAFGVGYWGSSNHGPNENIRLEDYRNGIKMVMEFLDEIALRL